MLNEATKACVALCRAIRRCYNNSAIAASQRRTPMLAAPLAASFFCVYCGHKLKNVNNLHYTSYKNYKMEKRWNFKHLFFESEQHLVEFIFRISYPKAKNAYPKDPINKQKIKFVISDSPFNLCFILFF